MNFLILFTSECLLQSQGFTDTFLSAFLDSITLLMSFDGCCEDINVILVVKLINFRLIFGREVTFWVDFFLDLNKDLVPNIPVFAFLFLVSIVFFLCSLLCDFLFWLIGGDWLVIVIMLPLRRRWIFVCDPSRSQVGAFRRSYNLGYFGFPFLSLDFGFFFIFLKLHIFNILNFADIKYKYMIFRTSLIK